MYSWTIIFNKVQTDETLQAIYRGARSYYFLSVVFNVITQIEYATIHETKHATEQLQLSSIKKLLLIFVWINKKEQGDKGKNRGTCTELPKKRYTS